VTRLTSIAAAPPPAIPTPHIEYWQLSPMLLVFGVAVVGVLVEAFAPRSQRRPLHVGLTLAGLAGAFALTIAVGASAHLPPGHVVAMGSVAVDGPALFIQGTILVLAFVSVLLLAEGSGDVSAFVAQAAAVPGSAEEREGLLAGVTHTEVYPLTMFAVAGMLLFPAANDLLTMFVALEVLSLPLYLLCGLARRRRLLSQEAAMKYFLLGAFSSAFFLFGIAMLYGYSGSVDLGAIAAAASSNISSSTLLYAGIALVGLGLLGLPATRWLPLLALVLAALAVGMGLAQPSLNSLISRRAGREEQGEVMGVSQSVGSLSRVVGPLAAGVLFSEFGRGAPYLWGAALVVAAWFLTLLLWREVGSTGLAGDTVE